MRSSIREYIDRTVGELKLPEKFSSAIASYTKKIVVDLHPECVILYGSLAKGTYTTASDIDLVVICRYLPEHFLDRLSYLQNFNDTACSIDAFGYTPREFHKMLQEGHVTALDALADGVPLYGSEHFAQLREVFQRLVQRGLHRSTCTWVLPSISPRR